MAGGERDALPEALSTPSHTSQRRNVAALASSLPLPSSRRVTTPNQALPNVRRTPSAQGPLGGYRSLSRYKGTPMQEKLLGKRSFSSSSLQDQAGFSTPQPQGSKRPLVSSVLATAPRPTRVTSNEHDAFQTPLMPRHHHNGISASPASDEYELQMLRSEYERRIQAEQHANQVMEVQMRSQLRELEALKCQRVEVLREWETERAMQQEKQQAWDKTRSETETQLASLRAETLRIQSRNDELESQLSTATCDAHTEIVSVKSQLVHLQMECELSKSQNESLSRTNEHLCARVHELESAPREKSTPLDDDAALFKDQLSQSVATIQRLEASNVRLTSENKRLADASARIDVLRESNRGLEVKLAQLPKLQEALLEKDAELASLRDEQSRWISMLEHGVKTEEHTAFMAAAHASDQTSSQVAVPETLSPDTLPAYISTLRGTIMGLHARIEGLSHSVEQMRTANVDLSRRAAQDSETETILRKELNQTSDQLLRAQRQIDVQSDELRRCKEVLASFEQEAQQGDTSYEATHQRRITGLEERIALLQTECDTLTQKLTESERIKSTINHPASEEALNVLEAQFRELEQHAQTLSTENEALWLRVGRGEFNAEHERCLVLTDNPVSRDLAIRTSTLEALKKENEGLLEQVEALHKQLTTAHLPAPATGTDAVVPLQTVDNLRAELSKLQETLQLKDKGMLRLKQVFTAQANLFREAVQSLFGYKIRFLENGKVKLTSAYAGSARGTTLVFRSDEGNVGEMKLQGEANDGLANVAHLRDYWLSDGIRHSVPCFLAALNLELYENTTQAIRSSFGADVEA